MVAIAKHLVPSYRASLLQREHFNATRDPVTGLLNQIAFEERIEQEIKVGARYNKTFALLMLTINHMGEIERSYGNTTTKNLLIEFAKRLRGCVRSTDTLAKLEDNSFVILLPDISSVRAIVKVVHNTHQRLLSPFIIDGEVIELNPSIGVSVYPDDGNEHIQLTNKAEKAMHDVIRDNAKHYQFFSANIAEVAEKQIVIEDKLQYAIEHHAYTIEYMDIHCSRDPQVELQELVVHWHDELLNGLSNSELFGHIESIEYSSFFSDFLLSQVCRELQNQKCSETGEVDKKVLLRLSEEQFFDSQLLRRFNQIITNDSVAAKNIAIVIEETAILKDLSMAISKVRELKRIGFVIVIDNFCAGLSYIGRFNRKLVDIIRVDAQLIRNLDDSMEELSVIEGIVRIANNLQIKTIVPGINNNYQYQTLINMGSDYWQGACAEDPDTMVDLSLVYTR